MSDPSPTSSTTPTSPSTPPPATDPEVAGALALRAVTRTLAALGATALGIGLVAVGAASLARVEQGGDGAAVVLPGLTVLMAGQLIALVATGLAAWVMVRLLRRQVPQPSHAVAGLSRALGLCAKVLLALCVLGVAIWVIARPGATLSALLGGAVAVQVCVVIGVVRGSLLKPA